MKSTMMVQKERFVQGLLSGKNSKEAYLFAFPESKKLSSKTVRNNASKLAKDPVVVARLEELKEEAQHETAVTLNEFVLDLQKVALADVNPLNIRVSDKLRAMELLSKVLGFDKTMINVEVEDTSMIDEQILNYSGPEDDHEDE